MAVDKLVDSSALDTNLTSVANAIRTKGGTSAQLAFPTGFVSAINAIQTGGPVPRKVKWAYVNNSANYTYYTAGKRDDPITDITAFVVQIKSNTTGTTYTVIVKPKSGENSLNITGSYVSYTMTDGLVVATDSLIGESVDPAITLNHTYSNYTHTYTMSISGYTINGLFIALGNCPGW